MLLGILDLATFVKNAVVLGSQLKLLHLLLGCFEREG